MALKVFSTPREYKCSFDSCNLNLFSRDEATVKEGLSVGSRLCDDFVKRRPTPCTALLLDPIRMSL